eukprot:3379-Heterococcus_DN1.PRE.1
MPCRMSAAAETATDYYALRFAGVSRLYGSQGLGNLREAHVCVVGLGGVGSWAVEALARSGVGALTLVDLDAICISNTNRQVHALATTVGKSKAEVLRDRVADINPDCSVQVELDFLTAANAAALLLDADGSGRYDCVLDAVDSLQDKCVILDTCRSVNMPIVTVGAAGGKGDPTKITAVDLSRVEYDNLLFQLLGQVTLYHGLPLWDTNAKPYGCYMCVVRADVCSVPVRKKLRQDYDFPRGTRRNPRGRKWGVAAVYSTELVQQPAEDTAKMGLGGCDSSFGTVSFVTGVFGLVAAGIVARIIAMQPTTDSNSDTSDSSSTDNDTDGSTSSGSGTTDATVTTANDSNDPAQWRWSHHALRNINKQQAAAVEAPDGHSGKSDAPTDSSESTAAINATTNAANTISSSSSSSSTMAAGDSASAVNFAVTDSASAVAVANGQQQQAVEPRLSGLYDAHCHLQMVAGSSSSSSDVSSSSAVHDEVTAAQAAGVVRAVVCATSTEDWAAVDTLATQHPDFVIPSFGIHPWWLAGHLARSNADASSQGIAAAAAAATINSGADSSSSSTVWQQELRRLLLKHEHAGVGECGLDKMRRREVPLDVQQEVSSAFALLSHAMISIVAAQSSESALQGGILVLLSILPCVNDKANKNTRCLTLHDQVMLQQLAIAADLERVTTLHCVGAFGRMLSALQQRPRQQQQQQQQQQSTSQRSTAATTAALLPPVVLHSFNGDASLVPALAAENCYFSFSGRGIITNASRSTGSSQLEAISASQALSA